MVQSKRRFHFNSLLLIGNNQTDWNNSWAKFHRFMPKYQLLIQGKSWRWMHTHQMWCMLDRLVFRLWKSRTNVWQGCSCSFTIFSENLWSQSRLANQPKKVSNVGGGHSRSGKCISSIHNLLSFCCYQSKKDGDTSIGKDYFHRQLILGSMQQLAKRHGIDVINFVIKEFNILMEFWITFTSHFNSMFVYHRRPEEIGSYVPSAFTKRIFAERGIPFWKMLEW